MSYVLAMMCEHGHYFHSGEVVADRGPDHPRGRCPRCGSPALLAPPSAPILNRTHTRDDF